MGSGKRASMREGPLANLFRKTETEGLEPLEPPAAEEPREPGVPERATPTPQERLRHAFSAEIPGDMMAPPEDEPPVVPPPSSVRLSVGLGAAIRASARRSCASWAWAAAA